MKITACPLDCYDACAVVVDSQRERMAGLPNHPFTQGALCPHLNRHFHEANRIKSARIDGKEVSISKALKDIAKVIRESGNNFLFFKGSGNVGFMQNITEYFVAKANGWTTKGSLCDGAGQAGIDMGRGVSLILPPLSIDKAEVVVVWGRNISVTDRHMLTFLKDKIVIVIDPVKTKLAKKASMHLQIRPRSDFYLAVLLSRFMYMEDEENKEFLQDRCEDAGYYHDFLQTFRVRTLLKKTDISLDDLGDMLYMLQNKKVVFLVGTGVQKYSNGYEVLRAIDALSAIIGGFGKQGCGVSFLGNSMAGFKSSIESSSKKVLKPNVDFGKFDTVLVQGANPAAQMPDTNRVEQSLEKVKNLIYFGLYENETSKKARIVLPAASFLEKEDLRLSYGHPFVQPMPKIKESLFGISEYEFTRYMFDAFGFEGLKTEEEYIKIMTDQCLKEDDFLKSPAYLDLPYSKRFETDSEKFEFMDEYEDEFNDEADGYWLLTPKSSHSLNSQFRRESDLFLPRSAGFFDKEMVKVSSSYGEVTMSVSIDDNLRDDCVLIYAGTFGVNKLTPSIISMEGDSACYQEIKVKIEKVKI